MFIIGIFAAMIILYSYTNEKQYKLLRKQYRNSFAKLNAKLQLENELDKDEFKIYHIDSLREVYAENEQIFLKDVYRVDFGTFTKHKGYDICNKFGQKHPTDRIIVETINNKITKIRY